MKFALLATALMGLLGFAYATAISTNAASTARVERPLLLQASEGEERIRRIPAKGAGPIVTATFLIKVDSHNGGSRDLMFFTDNFKPGAVIPFHRHLHQDEILYVERGSIHATVGDQSGDVHDGGTVFIPHNTWVTVKGIGLKDISLLAFFSGSDYDNYMRCSSVPNGQKVTPITKAQRRACARAGNVEYRALK